MNFIKENCSDILIERVNLTRATYLEAAEFKNVLTADINEGYKKIVVDLSGCEFMDSTFLSSLLISLKKMNTQGGELKIVSLHDEINALMELTRTVSIFEIYGSKEEALNSFTKAA